MKAKVYLWNEVGKRTLQIRVSRPMHSCKYVLQMSQDYDCAMMYITEFRYSGLVT